MSLKFYLQAKVCFFFSKLGPNLSSRVNTNMAEVWPMFTTTESALSSKTSSDRDQIVVNKQPTFAWNVENDFKVFGLSLHMTNKQTFKLKHLCKICNHILRNIKFFFTQEILSSTPQSCQRIWNVYFTDEDFSCEIAE